MSYNPDAMAIIVSGDLAPEMMEKLKSQLTADVLTSQEFSERERALAMQEQVEADTQENREEAGLEEGEGFNAPEEGEVEDVEVADTSNETTEGEGNDDFDSDTGGETESESGDTEGEGESTDADPSEEVEDEAVEVSEEDTAELTDEDKEVKDDLDEPNAAMEHAKTIGSKEVGRLLLLGTAKYKRRVRRQRVEAKLQLAQETLQMDAAQRQKLIRRLFYVKPADSGFTSKMQTFISTIGTPDDWVALIDTDGMVSADHDLSKKQIEAALQRAGIQMFDNVDTLADTFNQVQKAITEPAEGMQQDDTF